MIKNDRQFGIIRGRVERLRRLEGELQQRLEDNPENRARVDLELNAVRSERLRMQADLDDYESLKAGEGEVGVAHRVEDLPRLIIRARVAAGLDQGDLARKLGVKPQQIQRYEATDYESASLSRLIEVAHAVDLTLSPTIEGSVIQWPKASKVLGALGLDRAFLEKRFGLSSADDPLKDVMALSLASHVFSAPLEQLLEGDMLAIAGSLQPVGYKKPKRASERKAAALAGYARYLSRVLLQGLPRESRELPDDPLELNARITARGGLVTFEAVLETIWDAGVAVLPLDEGGGFQAAYWRVEDRDVIVINTTSSLPSLWLFYLLHEAGHAIETPGELRLIETAPGRDDAIEPGREQRANEFATEAIFGGRGHELVELALDRAQGKLALVQRSVRWVARTNNVDQGLLALNVAHRLSSVGEDWWGAAMTLQRPEGDPWRISRDALVQRLDWSAIEPLDVELLARALGVFPDVIVSSTRK